MIDESRLASLRPLPPSRGMALARWYHPTRHVPPLWSLTTSTACSAATLQVYCNLLPVMGFDAFSGSCDVQANLSVITPSPRTAISDPSKNTTRRQPHRVTAAVASLAFLLVCTTPFANHRASPLLTRAPVSGPRTRTWLSPPGSACHTHLPACEPFPCETPARAGSEASHPRARDAPELRRRPGRAVHRAERRSALLLTSSQRAPRTSPRGWIDAGDVNLTVPRRHRPRLQPPRRAAAPNLSASRVALWCKHRESRSSRASEEVPLSAGHRGRDLPFSLASRRGT